MVVRSRRWFARAAALVAAALCATLLITATSPAEDVTGAAGMRVYRDPATGEFTAPPGDDGADTLSAETAARKRVLEGAPRELVEEPGASAAGGVTMDLQGRFQSDQTATIDADGTVHTHCHPAESSR